MADTIDALRKSVASVCVWNVVAESGRAEELNTSAGYDPEKLEIRLIINGIEYDAVKALERMWQIREDEVSARATELVEGKFNDLMRETDMLVERIKHTCPW